MLDVFIVALLFGIVGTVAENGRIEGHLHYPACIPPADLVVCAERADGVRRCTSELSMTEEGLAYALELPAGVYLVYAISETYFPSQRA